ncbi:hypothetical protein ABZW96_24635 [Nocardia sp. NPDC004168]|uniref:hypothetical protein n=1 Tax=Nocardia TaxID=1817 RepID=UPI0033A93F2C
MDISEAVRGARLLAADIERSLGFSVEVGTEYEEQWHRFHELPWPSDPAASAHALRATERGWQSMTNHAYLVPYGELGPA